jgi:3-hydroxybutyryl-CoA dehydrogenase
MMEMKFSNLSAAPTLVVGAGIMGAGIAQVAAQAGHPVQLYDTREGAAAAAKARLAASFDTLVAKGKLSAGQAAATLARIEPVEQLQQAGRARLAVEAIVEDLAAKRALLQQLEKLLAPDAVLATNTSSISVTALAQGLAHPGRLVGMHFFNPVPLMRLVEVISGLHSEPAVAAAIFDLAAAWGKVPVHAKSTPGFIVNRIARPYYAEALALLQEQAATPQLIDACLRAAGFKMGPCELMDLIGHDTNFAVTQSVFAANFFDKRYAPSLVQRELVDGGLLGRKNGRGFYRYPDGAPALPALQHAVLAPPQQLEVHGAGAPAEALAVRLQQALAASPAFKHVRVVREGSGAWTGLSIDGARLVLTDGRCASELAAAFGRHDVAVFDRLPDPIAADAGAASVTASGPVLAPVLAYAVAPGAGAGWESQAAAWLAALGFAPQPVADTPGLVVARTLAMLINEAADAVQQGVCTKAGADAAMKLGVNYPAGPFEWLSGWSANGVAALLDRLDAHYRGERYRVSPWLRRHAVVIG